jgi:hypothetical protein
MQKHSGQKVKKKLKVAQRSTAHYHSPEELERIEAAARAKAETVDDSTGYAVQRDDGSFEVRDDLAEQLTEEFLVSALSGEETHALLNEDTDEEALGPLIETSAANVFGSGEDEMNSNETLKESLPTAGNWTLPPKGRVS